MGGVGKSPLSLAVAASCLEVVRIFTHKSQCNVNLGDEDGVTPLMLASKKGDLQVMGLLLQRPDIEVNAQTVSHRTTALILSILDRQQEALVKLISIPGIDVNLKKRNGDTALHVAAYLGHNWAVKMILAHGHIMPEQVNNRNLRPIDYAFIRGHNTTVELLQPYSKYGTPNGSNRYFRVSRILLPSLRN